MRATKQHVPEVGYSLLLLWHNMGPELPLEMFNKPLPLPRPVSGWLAKMVNRLCNDLHLMEIYEAVKLAEQARTHVRTDVCWLYSLCGRLLWLPRPPDKADSYLDVLNTTPTLVRL